MLYYILYVIVIVVVVVKIMRARDYFVSFLNTA